MTASTGTDERAPLPDAAITAMIAFSQVVAEFPELLPADTQQLAIQIDRDWSPRIGNDDQAVADAIIRQVRASLGAAPGSHADYCERCATVHASIDCPAGGHAAHLPASERSDALYDSAWCAGVNAGFNAALSDDPEARNKLIDSRAGYLKVLKASRAGAAQVPSEAQKQQIISEFLERTGQYVTNDASRECAIKCAVDKALQLAGAAQVPAEPETSSDRDAYEGAREDLLDWKRRALHAEAGLRSEKITSSRLVASLNADNAKFMGEPAQASTGWKLVPLAPTMNMCSAGKEAELRSPTARSALLVYRAMLAAAPEPTAGAAQAPSLSDALMSKLRRFAETTEDDQQYDIGKIAVRQLAQAGALRYAGGSRYQVTGYGDCLLSQPSQQGTKS